MAEVKKYKSMPLKCWMKAKEVRNKWYKEYMEGKEKGWILWTGSAAAFDSVTHGLGDDVANLPGEPYGATCAFNPEFSLQAMEATEAKGWARDLCSYMRNYWGCMYLNRFVLGGEFPKPDFTYTTHICCSHGKWFQVVADYLGIPSYGIDISVGSYDEIKPYKIDYIAEQLLASIEWMEKVTGRKYDDEKLIEAVYNECRAGSLWAEISLLNQAIPAPLDEKSMYSLYVLGVMRRASKEAVDFYEELRDEVKWRVENQIAAVPTERFRVMTDAQPPWGFLKLWRFLEKYGIVSIGSLYSLCLLFYWDYLEDGTWAVPKVPSPGEIKTREDAVRTVAEWEIKHRTLNSYWYSIQVKNEHMVSMAKQWHVDAAIIELNRGCEGSALGQMENRLAMLEAGYPVLTYEGNMADAREFDEGRVWERFITFLERLGLERLED